MGTKLEKIRKFEKFVVAPSEAKKTIRCEGIAQSQRGKWHKWGFTLRRGNNEFPELTNWYNRFTITNLNEFWLTQLGKFENSREITSLRSVGLRQISLFFLRWRYESGRAERRRLRLKEKPFGVREIRSDAVAVWGQSY